MKVRLLVTAGAVASMAFMSIGGPAGAAEGSPTCSDTLGIEVHAQHIVGDYVTGIGRDTLGWPPNGQVGDTIGGSGAVVRGGPGPAFHFVEGFAPGASFCLPQSQGINGTEHQQAVP